MKKPDKKALKSAGLIASFDKPLIFRADRELMEKYKLDIRDMESGTVANICGLNNAGIVIIKGKNLRCCLYNKSSKKATDVLLRQIPLFCTLLAEAMRNDIFRKAANTQKE